MPAAYDWLVVGDVALERSEDRSAGSLVGGAAARLAAHGTARGAKVALVGKTGDDAAGQTVREALSRFRVDLRFAPTAAGHRTTVWLTNRSDPGRRRVERGADLLLRLDEIPGPDLLRAGLTLVSGYSLSIEPARSAALGALRGAAERGGTSALQIEADLLWWTNARVARRVLEPAIGAARMVALTAADARVLFGPRTTATEALRAIGRLGPDVVYLAEPEGRVLVLDRQRVHLIAPAREAPVIDRFAGPAAFFQALLGGVAPRRAALTAVEYAQAVRRAGARRAVRTGPA